MAFGHPCPVSDLFGAAGRRLLAGLALPEPWAGDVAAALALIDDLDEQINGCEAALRTLGAGHYQRTRTRLGKQRGARIARVDLARRLAETIWYMLTTNKPFAPAGAAKPLAA